MPLRPDSSGKGMGGSSSNVDKYDGKHLPIIKKRKVNWYGQNHQKERIKRDIDLWIHRVDFIRDSEKLAESV